MHLPPDHPEAASARATLVVVALGRTPRLVDCLTALTTHASSVPFAVLCVINPAPVDDDGDGMLAARIAALGVPVIEPAMNLGWAGGLHRGRAAATTELLVWVQDDMVVLPGWLDALVAAADAHPEVGAFGSTLVDASGAVGLYNAGWCEPADAVAEWNASDTTPQRLPEGVTRFDWVTSKGLLCRTEAWDAVGGPDPGLYPLMHVDKDFSVHLRAHGWPVALVPAARLLHTGGQSSPGLLREYLHERASARVDARWAGVVDALPRAGAVALEHPCTGARAAEVEQWSAREAADIVIGFGRWVEARRRRLETELARAHADAEAAHAEVAAMRASRSWRITSPLRRLRRMRPPAGG